MTEPMTNEGRLDFLMKTGKLALETMALAEEDFNPVIVHEDMDGTFKMTLLAGGLGDDLSLLREGLVHAAETPQAMISLTADAFAMTDDGSKTEALQITTAFVGQDAVIEIILPYEREGVSIIWGEGEISICESAIAGGIRAAVTASHTLGG